MTSLHLHDPVIRKFITTCVKSFSWENSFSESPEATWSDFHKAFIPVSVNWCNVIMWAKRKSFWSSSCSYRANMSAFLGCNIHTLEYKKAIYSSRTCYCSNSCSTDLSNSIKVLFLWFQITARWKGWFNNESKKDCRSFFFFILCFELKDLQFEWKFERQWQ